MAKSKQQKREEALVRQRESINNALKRLLEVSNTSSQYYDAADHALAWIRCVKSAYAAHCDIHGNYLDERFYSRAGCYDFVSSHDPAVLAVHNKLYSLEELETICAQDGRTLFKTAYGTPPFVEKAEFYDINDAGSIDTFQKAGERLNKIASDWNLSAANLRKLEPGALHREKVLVEGANTPHNFGDSYPAIRHLLKDALKNNIVSLASVMSLNNRGLCTTMVSGINDIAKREALHKQLASDRFEQHKGDFTDADNIPVISSLLEGGLRRGEIFVIGAGSPPLSNYRGPFAHKSELFSQSRLDALIDTCKRTVIDSITIPPESPEDSNRADIIMDTTSTFGNHEMYDYYSGKISRQEYTSIVAKRAQQADPNWNPEIDGVALLAFHHNKMSSNTYLKIRNRKENGLSDAECLDLISVAG